MKPSVIGEVALISPTVAKALADPWRFRILIELSVRPLSPSQFVELAGGELDAIAARFRQLADWGFIEVAETKTGGHRRGGIEHVYRSIHRAHFDTSAWEALPQARRNALSGPILESYLGRIRDAVSAGTLDLEVDRHLSWDEVPLDRIAWTALGARLDEILHGLPALVLEAADRMARTGEDPIPTTIGMAAFRSARKTMPYGLSQVERPAPITEVSPFAGSAKITKAITNKWRSRILMELRVRPMSPTQFVREVGGSQRHISRCFRELAQWGFIEAVELADAAPRRGFQEKVYRLKQRAHFDTGTWEELPRFLREEFSVSILQSYFARVTEAIEANTFDLEVDRHLSWDAIALDRIAWKKLGDRLDKVLYSLPALEEEAAKRIQEAGTEPILTVVGLAVFRSPVSSGSGS